MKDSSQSKTPILRVKRGMSLIGKLGMVTALSGAGLALMANSAAASPTRLSIPSPITYTDATTTVTATVPTGVCAVEFDAIGGQGGGTEGGFGGQVEATATMAAGDTYSVAVGGAGGTGAGGLSGGAASGGAGGSNSDPASAGAAGERPRSP